MRSRATGMAGAALAAGMLAGCAIAPWRATDETPLRIDQAVSDARDPVERGGERSVPGSGQLLDVRRTESE